MNEPCINIENSIEGGANSKRICYVNLKQQKVYTGYIQMQ